MKVQRTTTRPERSDKRPIASLPHHAKPQLDKHSFTGNAAVGESEVFDAGTRNTVKKAVTAKRVRFTANEG